MIDLRSDVITQPTEAMWEAMRGASVGWALMGEDPSVNELEALAARLTLKEAALFIPTGSMANLVALMTHARPGEQVVLEANSHILWCEEWSFAAICGLVPKVVRAADGRMDPEDVQRSITEQRFRHRPTTGLICLENTHNMAGGTILRPADVSGLANVAQQNGIPIHLDGARLLNASVALGLPVDVLTADVDTVTLNLNKGLSAPAGALLCGQTRFIEESRINLKRLGGASVHQAGILAAAGLVALQTMIPQLAEDHRRAQALGCGLAKLASERAEPGIVETNIVMVSIDPGWLPAAAFLSRLADRAILGSLCTASLVRFVTHRHISDGDIQCVIDTITSIVGDGGR